MNIPKACFFDLDGVLLDTEPIHQEAWFRSAKAYGKVITTEELKTLKGRRRIDCAKQIIDSLNKSVELQDFLEYYQSIILNMLTDVPAIQGAKNLVKKIIEAGISVALVSSSSKESFINKTKNHPWINDINIKVLGDDPLLNRGKPYPDPYLLAAQKLNVEPIDSWAIEDSESGSYSALRAGCKVWCIQTDVKLRNKIIKETNISNTNLTIIDNLIEIEKKLEFLIQST